MQHESTEGLCQCGCGGRTPLATRTRPDLGTVKGQPLRFINGHSQRALMLRLAAGRRRRMVAGRPVFDLTEDHIRASVETALRLARNASSPRSNRGLDGPLGSERVSCDEKVTE